MECGLYSPQEIRNGAVTHYRTCESIEIVQRKEISTPWQPKRNLEEPRALFKLW